MDRVPVAYFHHFIPCGDFGKGLLDDAVFEKNIQGHRLARQLFDPDIAKIMNDSLFFMPLDVSFVERASDLRKVEPVSMQSPFVRRSLELTKRVREIYDGPDAPSVFITSCSPTFVLRNSLSVNGMPNVGGARPGSRALWRRTRRPCRWPLRPWPRASRSSTACLSPKRG